MNEPSLGQGWGLGPAPPPPSPFNSEAPPSRRHAQIGRSLPRHALGWRRREAGLGEGSMNRGECPRQCQNCPREEGGHALPTDSMTDSLTPSKTPALPLKNLPENLPDADAQVSCTVTCPSL